MTGRHNGIFIGLFLVIIAMMFLQFAEQIHQPEVVLNLVSAVVTLGIVLAVYSLIRHRNRQEN